RLKGHFHDRHYSPIIEASHQRSLVPSASPPTKDSPTKQPEPIPGCPDREPPRPLSGPRGDRGTIGHRPLSWWAVRRVTEYSGRVNLWLAGGFGILYAAYVLAGTHWPPWLGRIVFEITDSKGGISMLTTGLVLLAAAPAAMQYGLWDSNAQ